jgi:P-type Ca2+ transporter type 2C
MRDWHSMSIDEVIRELNTNPYQGLSPEEAGRRLTKYGRNEVRTMKPKERNQIARKNVRGILVTTLYLALLVSLLIGFLFGGQALPVPLLTSL